MIVRLPRKYVPLLRAGAIVLFVLSVIAVWQLDRDDRQVSLVHSACAARSVGRIDEHAADAPSFWGHVATTLIEVLGGLFIGAALAIVLGYLHRQIAAGQFAGVAAGRRLASDPHRGDCAAAGDLVRLRHHAQDRDQRC